MSETNKDKNEAPALKSPPQKKKEPLVRLWYHQVLTWFGKMLT